MYLRMNSDLQWTVGAFFLEQEIDYDSEHWTADNLGGDDIVIEGLFLPHVRRAGCFW